MAHFVYDPLQELRPARGLDLEEARKCFGILCHQ